MKQFSLSIQHSVELLIGGRVWDGGTHFLCVSLGKKWGGSAGSYKIGLQKNRTARLWLYAQGRFVPKSGWYKVTEGAVRTRTLCNREFCYTENQQCAFRLTRMPEFGWVDWPLPQPENPQEPGVVEAQDEWMCYSRNLESTRKERVVQLL